MIVATTEAGRKIAEAFGKNATHFVVAAVRAARRVQLGQPWPLPEAAPLGCVAVGNVGAAWASGSGLLGAVQVTFDLLDERGAAHIHVATTVRMRPLLDGRKLVPQIELEEFRPRQT